MKKIFWLVGDKSGDMHASRVMKELNETISNIQHFGIGGALMSEQGLEPLFPFQRFLIMGFVEVIKHIPFILKVESTIKRFLSKIRPDIVVLVDYPGLNLRVARIAKKMRLKVFYFICPQFWAWKHYRVLQLKKYCDFVACIFPFEKGILDKYEINSSYVGHPIMEEIEIKLDKKSFADKHGLDSNKTWIGFFPGSRRTEVKRLLPIYQETIKRLSETKPEYQFLISIVPPPTPPINVGGIDMPSPISVGGNDLPHPRSMREGGRGGIPSFMIQGYNYEIMKHCDFLIVKSGTSTVETAILGTPFALVYKANYFSYFLAKMIIKVKFIGMPNIILDKKVVPELIQSEVTPEKIIETIFYFIENKKEYNEMKTQFNELHNILGTKSASKTTADLIIELGTQTSCLQ